MSSSMLLLQGSGRNIMISRRFNITTIGTGKPGPSLGKILPLQLLLHSTTRTMTTTAASNKLIIRQTLPRVLQQRFYHSTGISWNNLNMEQRRPEAQEEQYDNIGYFTADHCNQQIIELTKQPPNNNNLVQQIDHLMDQIGNGTNIVLKEQTIIIAVQNCIDLIKQQQQQQQTSNQDGVIIAAAEAAEKLVLDWLVRFYFYRRLDKPPSIIPFQLVLQAWKLTGHDKNSTHRQKQLVGRVEQLVQDLILPFSKADIDSIVYNYNNININTAAASAVMEEEETAAKHTTMIDRKEELRKDSNNNVSDNNGGTTAPALGPHHHQQEEETSNAYDAVDYHNQIIKLTEQKGDGGSNIDLLHQIDTLMETIMTETNVVLEEKTFLEAANNCSTLLFEDKTKGAEITEKLVFHWMMKFYNTGRLKQQLKPDMFGTALQGWVDSGSPQSGDKIKTLLYKLIDMVQKEQVGPFSNDATIYKTILEANYDDNNNNNQDERKGGEGNVDSSNNRSSSGTHKPSIEASQERTNERNADADANHYDSSSRNNKPSVRANQVTTQGMNADADVRRDYHKKIIQLTKQKGNNIDTTLQQQIDRLFDEIWNETNIILEEKTFFLAVKNCVKMKNVQGAEIAERLVFHWMMKFYNDEGRRRLDHPPKPNIFGVALQSWVVISSGNHRKSGERAGKFLDRMEGMARDGLLPFSVDTTIYNTVIQAYAIQRDHQNARAVFDRCRNAFLTEGNDDARPDVITWNTILDAYSKSTPNRQDATLDAEELFSEMEKDYSDGILKEPPNTRTYNALINMSAKCNQPERAEFWLEEMLKGNAFVIKGDASAQPSLRSFNAVMEAWARQGTIAGAKQCEKILHHMIKLSREEGMHAVRPISVSYGIIINAFAKCNQPEGADFWLEEMFKSYRGGNKSAQPNRICFNSVLDGWARSGVDNAGEKCEEILNRMTSLFEKEGLPVRPDGISYNSVSMAYARQGQPQQSERIIQRQLEDFEAGNKLAEPNLRSFLSIIHGWALAKEENSGEQAELVLDRVKELHKNGTLKEGPNTYIYSAVINAWGNLGNHEKAREVYDTMMEDSKQENTNVQFDNAPFSSLLLAYSNAEIANAGELADVVLEEMKELQLVPNHGTLENARRCWMCSLDHDNPKAQERLEQLQAGNEV